MSLHQLITQIWDKKYIFIRIRVSFTVAQTFCINSEEVALNHLDISHCAISYVICTVLRGKHTGGPSWPRKVDSDGHSNQEEEEWRGDHLHGLLPSLHFDILQHDEAKQDASNGAPSVSYDAGARTSVTGISVSSVRGMAKVKSKEAEQPNQLESPCQLTTACMGCLVAAKPWKDWNNSKFSFAIFCNLVKKMATSSFQLRIQVEILAAIKQ